MPSRKRSKGKARKAKAHANPRNEQPRISLPDCQLRERISFQCSHGCDERMITGSRFERFFNGFEDLLRERRKRLTSEYCLDSPNAIIFQSIVFDSFKSICRKHPEILRDKANRELLKSFYLQKGADCLLEVSKDRSRCSLEEGAGCAAVCVILLEAYDPAMCAEDFALCSVTDMKQRDTIQGCRRSLVRLYAKRLPCNCLNRMYLETKSQIKTAICRYCGDRVKRCSLLVCTLCRAEQYCTKYCQVSDWSRHRLICQGLPTTEKEEIFKQPTREEINDLAKSLRVVPEEDYSKVLVDLKIKCPSALKETSDFTTIDVSMISPEMFWKLVKYINVLIKCPRDEAEP